MPSSDARNLHVLDGYVAHTFGPNSTSVYLSERLHWSYNMGASSDRNCIFIFRQLFDYGVDTGTGSVVPQRRFAPVNSPDLGRRLQMPIFFDVKAGSLGIPLQEAATRDVRRLDNPNRPILANNPTSTTTFCFQWPGYSEYIHQFQTPRTIGELAIVAGSLVKAFLNEAHQYRESSPPYNPYVDPSWRERIVIIGAVHVSPGLWQLLFFLPQVFHIYDRILGDENR